MTARQRVVSGGGAADPFGLLIADVLELAGRLESVADDIARHEGQTRTRWYALSVFSGEPLTVSQAARRLGTSRQAVQRSADDIVARGYATVHVNPDHRTSPFIRLTDEGAELLARINAYALHTRQKRLRGISVDQAAAGHELIKTMLAGLESD